MHRAKEMHIKDNQIRFKNSMLRSCLYDYSDAHILAKGTLTVAQATAAAPNNVNNKIILCAIYYMHEHNERCTNRCT